MMEWKWTKEQLEPGRIARARKVELSNVVVNIPLSECHAECVSGSTGEVYHVSLQDCTCRDFTVGKKPCKHMIALAMEARLLNESGQTMDEEIASQKATLAEAYGFYYLFDEPIMSDKEYDDLKYELADRWAFGDDSERIMGEIINREKIATQDLGTMIYHGILNYLQENKVEYVDKVTVGGGLYIFDKKTADELKKRGCNLYFTEKGTRSTNHRPAWYFKSIQKSSQL